MNLSWEAEKYNLSKMTIPFLSKRMAVKDATGGEIGYTGPRGGIYIAREHDVFSMLQDDEKRFFRKGVFAHELLHQIFTDFDYHVMIKDSLKSYEKPIFQMIANVLEDPAIEYWAKTKFGGSLLKSLKFSIAHIYEQSPNISESETPFSQLINAFVQFGDMGLIKGEFTFPETKETFLELAPLFNSGILEPSGKKRLDIAREIMDKSRCLWEEDAKQEEEMKNLLKSLMSSLGKSEMSGMGSGEDGDPDSAPDTGDKEKRRKKIIIKLSPPSDSDPDSDSDSPSSSSSKEEGKEGKEKENPKSSSSSSSSSKETEEEKGTEEKEEGKGKGKGKGKKDEEKKGKKGIDSENAVDSDEGVSSSSSSESSESKSDSSASSTDSSESSSPSSKEEKEEGNEGESVEKEKEDETESSSDSSSSTSSSKKKEKEKEEKSEEENNSSTSSSDSSSEGDEKEKEKESEKTSEEENEEESGEETSSSSDSDSDSDSEIDSSDSSPDSSTSETSSAPETSPTPEEEKEESEEEIVSKDKEMTEEDKEEIRKEIEKAEREMKKEKKEEKRDTSELLSMPLTEGLCRYPASSIVNVRAPVSINRTQYNAIVAEMSTGITNISKQIKKMISFAQEETEYATKGRLNVKRLNCGKNTARVFDRKRVPSEVADLVVGIAVDLSGSMSGDRIENAKKCCIALAEVCNNLKVPVYVMGYSGQLFRGDRWFDGLYHEHYITWRNTLQDRLSLLNIRALSQNIDGSTFRYFTEIMRKKVSKHKLMIVISDGTPCAIGYGGDTANKDTALAIKNARKVCDVLGVALGDADTSVLHSFYGNDFLHVSQPSDLFAGIANKLKKFVHKWIEED